MLHFDRRMKLYTILAESLVIFLAALSPYKHKWGHIYFEMYSIYR